MFVYLYVDSTLTQKVVWILSKIEGKEIWFPVSVEDPVDALKAQRASIENRFSKFRQSLEGYSFFIKLLNLNMPELKIELNNVELVKLSANSIKHSTSRLDNTLTSCLQDRLQVALSDINVKLDFPDDNSSIGDQDPDTFDVILSPVDLSDEDFKRSAVRNLALDLNFIGSVDLKDYTELDHLIEKSFHSIEEENVRIGKRISFSDFEKRLAEGKVQLVQEKY